MSDDDEYEIPLQDQRIFGAGIKRKRVKFVPSSSTATNTPPPQTTSAKSVSDLYLSLVLPKAQTTTPNSAEDSASSERQDVPIAPATPQNLVCEICNLPLDAPTPEVPAGPLSNNPSPAQPPKTRPHEASLAHQVCLKHSHPPSHIDRTRKGLTYLSSYGWDPDSRRGLGAEGQGIQFPIKVKAKDDKLGIGVVLPKEGERRKEEKPKKLDAGKVRKLYEVERKKGERLREMFYGSEDLERYLGGG